MWCTQCQQDVPAAVSADVGKYCCPRCGTDLCDGTECRGTGSRSDCADQETTAERPGSLPVGVGPEPPPVYDGWELEEQLRHIERLLTVDRADDRCPEAADQQELLRLDAAHAGPAGWHYPLIAESARQAAANASPAASWLPVLTWTVLSLGLMAFVCGGVLLAWSMASARQDLWTIGMPIALGGQIVLLIGLILQLDSLWHDNRYTAAKLNHVDQRLHDLNTTTLLGGSHASASGSFYSHMAGGASPQLLLADLKSQLDLLAVKLGQEGR